MESNYLFIFEKYENQYVKFKRLSIINWTFKLRVK